MKEPVSRSLGCDRGISVPRTYINRFVESHSDAIRGNVLEFGSTAYCDKYRDQIARRHVVSVEHLGIEDEVVDLSRPWNTSRRFDCIILTQVLFTTPNPRVFLENVCERLSLGGCLIATDPGICQISKQDEARWGDRWRFTRRSYAEMMRYFFGRNNFEVFSFGNLTAATYLLEGRCSTELDEEELWHVDEDYPVIVAGFAEMTDG